MSFLQRNQAYLFVARQHFGCKERGKCQRVWPHSEPEEWAGLLLAMEDWREGG